MKTILVTGALVSLVLTWERNIISSLYKPLLEDKEEQKEVA